MGTINNIFKQKTTALLQIINSFCKPWFLYTVILVLYKNNLDLTALSICYLK